MLEMGTLWCNWQHVFIETTGNCKESGKNPHPAVCPQQGHVTDGLRVTSHLAQTPQEQAKLLG